jgi:hypothetical protein
MNRAFPKFEAIFDPDQTETFLRRVETTCRQLSQIAVKGAPGEKERASAALAAFTHGVNLVKELGELRSRMAEEATSAQTGR